MSLLGDVLKSVNPLIHEVTDGTTVVLTSGSGAVFDPGDLDASTGSGQRAVVPCSSPWPARLQGEVQAGLFLISVNGQAPELTVVPRPGLLAGIDGRTYTVVRAEHDLDSDDWILTIEGGG